MKKLTYLTVTVLITLFSSTTFAGGAGVTVKGGTTGIGADLTVGLGDYLSLRGGISGWEHEQTFTMDDAEVDGAFDLLIFPILLDWHPAGGGFRISAGAVINQTDLTLSATDKVLTLNDIDFDVDSLDGSIETDELSYYFGIGYGNASSSDSRIHFACDFGVIYYGEPEVKITAVSDVPGVQPALNSALAEEIAELEEEMKDFSFYPVISIGMSVSF